MRKFVNKVSQRSYGDYYTTGILIVNKNRISMELLSISHTNILIISVNIMTQFAI